MRIWRDRWIARNPIGGLITQKGRYRFKWVLELLDLHGNWDTQKLQQFFLPVDVWEIRKIRPCVMIFWLGLRRRVVTFMFIARAGRPMRSCTILQQHLRAVGVAALVKDVEGNLGLPRATESSVLCLETGNKLSDYLG